MEYTPYKFKESDAYRFADFVNIKVKTQNGNLHFEKCPYCGERTTDKNTFAISLQNGTFNCLRSTCGAKGNMVKLSQDFGFSLGNEVDEYFTPRKRYREFKTPAKPITPKPPAVKYLESRGISAKTAERYEITTQNGKDNILVFPFYDEFGKMRFVKYRKTDFDKEKDKAKEWSEKGGMPILFGMKQCDPKAGPLVITEGQMDSLSVAESGIPNAVSVPNGAKGMTWVPHCWDWVYSFSALVVFGDWEKGRMTLLDDLKNRFKIRIRRVREDDYGGCKDANDILRKYGPEKVRQCVENAEDVPIKHVINLADVEDINMFDIPKLATGFKELDKLLYGGLPFGGITLLTGKAGKGKSSVASQILINAAEAGHRCFAYSGELPNHMFKSWMTYQLAGPGHVFEYETRSGARGYNISATNKRLIDEWYRNKIDIYDSNSVDDENDDLLEIVEEMIARYNADVICLDNLMTALDLGGPRDTDKYERQSKFVKRLARIAMQHKVLIILIAHMRKNSYAQNGNDEVSGSSDITNLASITLMYDTSEKISESQRLLKVWKNRLFGKINPDGWVMDYDERSKRIYGKGDDLMREYGWNPNSDGFHYDSDAPFK